MHKYAILYVYLLLSENVNEFHLLLVGVHQLMDLLLSCLEAGTEVSLLLAQLLGKVLEYTK